MTGFADMPEVVHKAASRKGGRVKTNKGFAANRELAKSAGSRGGRAKYENQSKEDRKTEEHRRDGGTPVMEAILGVLDADNHTRPNSSTEE